MEDDDPQVQRKGRRAILVLYIVTFVGVALPVLLWILREGEGGR